MTLYPFPESPEDTQYRVFPPALENDPSVFFHGTAQLNLQSIVANGFVISGALPSISFGTHSDIALKYACDSRKSASQEGCILAARFENLDDWKAINEGGILHVYLFDKQPVILGHCIVPALYRWV